MRCITTFAFALSFASSFATAGEAQPLVSPMVTAPTALAVYRPLELRWNDASRADRLDAGGASVAFTGPDGASMTMAGFGAGDGTWRVRFRPHLAGAWTWKRTDADESGTFTVAPVAADEPNALYRHGGILRNAPSGRYLTHDDGTPFFWLGDTWWFAPSQLLPWEGSTKPGDTSAFRTCVDQRAQQGYNVVQWAFIGGEKSHGGVKGVYGTAFDGIVAGAYWTNADACMLYANERGLVPVIGFGFHRGNVKQTREQLQLLWDYVLARYGACATTFLFSGEYNQATGTKPDGKGKELREDEVQRIANFHAIGAHVRARDPWKRALTIHPWAHGAEGKQSWDQPWVDPIMLQGAHGAPGPKSSDYRAIWKRKPAKAFIEAEVTYEGINGHNKPAGTPAHGPLVVRRNAWKAVLSGSCGFTYGSHGLWYPNQDEQDDKFSDWGPPMVWWKALEREGGAQMPHMKTLCERVPWHQLAPIEPQQVGKLEVYARGNAGTWIVYAEAGIGAKAALTLAVPKDVTATSFRVVRGDPRTGAVAAPVTVAAADGKLALPARPDTQDWVFLVTPEQP